MNSSHPHTYPFALLGKIKQFQNFVLRYFTSHQHWIKGKTQLETNHSSRNQIIIYIQTKRFYFSHMS